LCNGYLVKKIHFIQISTPLKSIKTSFTLHFSHNSFNFQLSFNHESKPPNPNNPNDPNYDPYNVYFNDDQERYLRGYAAYEQFVALYDQEAGGSVSGEKRMRTYIPREREVAKQHLIDDYFGTMRLILNIPKRNLSECIV
jgi:hypothetical protein